MEKVAVMVVDELGKHNEILDVVGKAAVYHERLFPILRLLWGAIGTNSDWSRASTVVLLSGYCACCGGGRRILEWGAGKLREAGFRGKIIAVPVVVDYERELDSVRRLPGVVAMFQPTAEQILQEAGVGAGLDAR